MILNPFRTPSPLQVASRELEEAQRSKLNAESQQEFYEAMCKMLNKRIARLRLTVRSLADEAASPEDTKDE